MLHLEGIDLLDLRMESAVEFRHLVLPWKFPLCDIVEFLLYLGGEVIVEDIREVFSKEIVDNHSDVGRYEFPFLAADVQGFGHHVNLALLQCDLLKVARRAFLLAALYVFTLLYGGNGRRVGRRATYAELLHLLHERSLRISCRSLGEVFSGGDLLRLEVHPYRQRRK